MKDDLPNFPHDNDSRNHPKMKALRARYGWAGYGHFWAVNEMIASSPGAVLDISRKVVKASAACELGLTPDAFEEFLKFLGDQDECGLIIYGPDGKIKTDRTQEAYSAVAASREEWREKKKTQRARSMSLQDEPDGSPSPRGVPGESMWDIDNVPEGQIDCPPEIPPGNLHKGKERKGKEITGEERREKTTLTPSQKNPFPAFGDTQSPAHHPTDYAATWNQYPHLTPFPHLKPNVSSTTVEEIRKPCLPYQPDQVHQAIRNFGIASADPNGYKFFPEYPTLISFLKKGLDVFAGDGALERLRKPGESGEMTESEAAAWLANQNRGRS